MLTHLSIQNFTLVDKLDLEIYRGTTAVTGETGAGKSIMLDALGLALGDRADADRVRHGCSKAEISASFDVRKIPAAKAWLNKLDLDDGNHCILRRVVTAEGRSRGYVNGQPTTMSQLRELGDMLIDIHSQHEHQSLLRKDTHKKLLDEFGNLSSLTDKVESTYKYWHLLRSKLDDLQQQSQEAEQRQQLLSFQVEELNLIDLKKGELEALEQEQKNLANAESNLHACQQVIDISQQEEYGLDNQLRLAIHKLGELAQDHPPLANALELMTSAEIQIQEANNVIGDFISATEINPERLEYVEQRLSCIYQCARKHKVHPSKLIELHQTLCDELENLTSVEHLNELIEAEIQAKQAYLGIAVILSDERKKSAEKLTKAVNGQLKKLAMTNARFAIALSPLHEKLSVHGLENIEFLISTNPGNEPKALAKVASGGELSRISLAIVVVTAKTSRIPTLVFDEVDVGIGGETADVIGSLLRELGKRGQVICVTHLGQVAAKAHQHFQVEKQFSRKTTSSRLISLDEDQKITEIARMIGGKQSEQSLAHAKAMLNH